MNWRAWLLDLGFPLGHSPDLEAVLLAVMLVVGAVAIGWFAGTRLGPPLAHWWRVRSGVENSRVAALFCSVIRYGVAALLLLLAGNAAGLGAYAQLIVAGALGIVVALLVYHVAHGVRLGGVPALILAGVALVASTAGMLGGMRPLIEGLGRASFTIGARTFSLLAVFNFMLVAAILIVIARIVNRLLVHSIGHIRAFDRSQQVLVQKLAGLAVIAAAVLLGIDLLGIDLTALAVFSGAFGLAVGFGLQKTLGNLISGLILLMDRSVKPGDVIVVGDTFGSVNKIGVRAVSVVTRDGKEHLIPNELLMTERVENWSYSSRDVRIHIPVGVGYGSDLALAQKLMIEAVDASPRALRQPKPSVWLRSFGESSVDHEILVWIGDPEAGVGNVQSEILNRLWQLFKDNGIELPYPQRDIHIRSIPPELAAPRRDA